MHDAEATLLRCVESNGMVEGHLVCFHVTEARLVQASKHVCFTLIHSPHFPANIFKIGMVRSLLS